MLPGMALRSSFDFPGKGDQAHTQAKDVETVYEDPTSSLAEAAVRRNGYRDRNMGFGLSELNAVMP